MKIIRTLTIFVFFFLFDLLFARSPSWNGYIQFRYSNDYRMLNSFRVRRTKLFFKGHYQRFNHVSYKIQAIFNDKKSGWFTLQDVYGEYSFQKGFIRFGQMVPYFSIQRLQPDSKIPLMERALVVNSLIPTAETGARDIGVTLGYTFSPRLESVFGIFNGNGGNVTSNENKKFLFTNRTAFILPFMTGKVTFYFSSAYRRSDHLLYQKILGKNGFFTGKDFRWAGGFEFRNAHWQAQAEYLETHLENVRVWGYYGMMTYTFKSSNLFTVLFEKYHDAIAGNSETPWFGLNFSHLLNGDQFKFMIEHRLQDWDHQITMIQVQLFFNKK